MLIIGHFDIFTIIRMSKSYGNGGITLSPHTSGSRGFVSRTKVLFSFFRCFVIFVFFSPSTKRPQRVTAEDEVEECTLNPWSVVPTSANQIFDLEGDCFTHSAYRGRQDVARCHRNRGINKIIIIHDIVTDTEPFQIYLLILKNIRNTITDQRGQIACQEQGVVPIVIVIMFTALNTRCGVECRRVV